MSTQPDMTDVIFLADRLADYVRMHFAAQVPEAMPGVIEIALRDYRAARRIGHPVTEATATEVPK